MERVTQKSTVTVIDVNIVFILFGYIIVARAMSINLIAINGTIAPPTP